MIVQHNARVLAMRDEAERAQVEAEREAEHAEALHMQAERERFRLESAKQFEQKVAETTESPTHEGVQSTTIQPLRRRGV